jgi:HEPN domain-containing protein
MKGDPKNPADWQKLVVRDLASARRNLAEGDLSFAAFGIQQAAEKAIKGWLIGRGWSLVKTHDLRRLVLEAAALGMDIRWFEASGVRLLQLYFTDRYVDDSADPEADAVEMGCLPADVEKLYAQLFPTSPPPPDHHA